VGSDDQTTADSEPERTPKEVTLRADFDVDLDGDGVVDGAGTLETTAVDIDGDGVADAIVERETMLLDLDGDGRVETIRVTETITIDVDGDGEPDIVEGVEVTDVIEERRIHPDGAGKPEPT